MRDDFSLILLDKREGVTSFSSLGEIKRMFPGSKVGHAGTLDKFASGLMIVMTGGATRLNPVFSSFGKKYRATIEFGSETDTLDPEGNVISKSDHYPTLDEIKRVLPSFLGEQDQIPPMYSALHVDGKRAYLEARKGKDIEMPVRRIRIDSIDFISYDGKSLTIECAVSKGTYIRSLGRDIALSLGSRGHLTALRRLSVGPFSLSDIGKDTKSLLEMTSLFSRITMDEKKKKEIDNGVTLSRFILSDSDPARPYAFVSIGGEEYGIAGKEGKFSFLVRW